MPRNMKVAGLILVLAFVLASVGCRPGGGESPAEFYKGKTITIVVPYAAGGGTDTQSRLFGPYLQKYTGASSVVIENMTGAGGNRAVNYLFNTAKPDGLTLGSILGDTAILRQLLREPEVQYDVSKFTWIGRWFIEPQALAVGTQLPGTAVKDLAALNPFKEAVINLVSPTTLNVVLFAEVFNLNNMKLLPGYAGTSEIMVAMAQGEVHGFTTDLSVLDPFVKKGVVKLVVVFSEKREPQAPDVPTIYELAKQANRSISGDTAKFLKVQDAGAALRRALAGPPGLPKDRLDFLRDAFAKAIQDKEWQAAWQKAKIPLDNPGTGDEIQKMAQAVALSEQEINTFKLLLNEKYVKK